MDAIALLRRLLSLGCSDGVSPHLLGFSSHIRCSCKTERRREGKKGGKQGGREEEGRRKAEVFNEDSKAWISAPSL